MLPLSVLFVILYCLSFKWFKTSWRRWLFWTFLIALPMGIIATLFLILTLVFSATPADLPNPKHLTAYLGAICAYFTLRAGVPRLALRGKKMGSYEAMFC